MPIRAEVNGGWMKLLNAVPDSGSCGCGFFPGVEVELPALKNTVLSLRAPNIHPEDEM
jgi:hypothetical protein